MKTCTYLRLNFPKFLDQARIFFFQFYLYVKFPSLCLSPYFSINLLSFLCFSFFSFSFFSFTFLSHSESESMADQLAKGHRADRAVRCGSSTVLAVGIPSIRSDISGSHSASYIYPLHFRSTRIYWSMSVPLTRTLYIFEVM